MNSRALSPYSIEQHRHRFAAWAAGRAASVIGCRFSVETAKSIIESIGLDALRGPESLPDCNAFDGVPAGWRAAAIAHASESRVPFTHGVAAKLINVYLKAVFVCGGHHDHGRVAALHPPIDSLLLVALGRAKIGDRSAWRKARQIRWSNMDSTEYQNVIEAIRAAFPGRPLWHVEEHWRGYQ